MNYNDPRICIDVSDFSIEKKKLVQDAFFKLGDAWGYGGTDYLKLDSLVYTNTVSSSYDGFLWCSNHPEYYKNKPYKHTFNELMKRAGMEEYMEKRKPTDEVTITTTLRALAEVYAVMGKVKRGLLVFDRYLWEEARDILDPDRNIYNKMISSKDLSYLTNYVDYREEWEEALFGKEETQAQKEARELEEKAQEMLDKAKKLRGNL